ncbi:uncharacterized protein LOC110440926, partial [Mizuhopecten yessoensis]|uniref:uncharacterized protein LOC110440926 n=1 Tax=Mizuhopecten yessoensis TaxID=6573 RepID=UPI000B4581F9
VIKPKRRRLQSFADIRKNVPKSTPRRLSLFPNTCGILEEDNATLDVPEVTNRNFLWEVRDFQTTSARNNQQSHISSESSDFRTTNSIVRNLSKLPCSERTAQTGNVMVEEIGLPGETMTEDVVELWEEMMYLSDLKSKHTVENVSTKLRRYMEEKHMAKKEMKAFYEEWKKRRISSFKPLSIYAEIDAEESGSFSGVQYRFLDCVPEFEDFLLVLEEDSKFDPRFKRAKQISRKIAKRYNIAKENISGITGVETDHKKTHKVSSRLAPISEKGAHRKKSFRFSDNKLRSSSKTPSGARRVSMPSRSSVTSIHGNEKMDNERTAHEVGVVTASKSCEKHVLEQSGRSSSHRGSVCKGSKFGESKKRRNTQEGVSSIYLTSPAGANYILYQPPSSKVETKRRGTVHVTNTSGPIAEVELEQEPPEKAVYGTDQNDKELFYSSEEDNDDTMDFQNLFDSRKLNTKYSFERLRGKNYHKKKPAFFGVLKKYYKMQKVADAFASPKSKRKSVFQRLLDKDKTNANVPDTEIIGTLKTYNFLYHRRRTRTEVEECDFSSLSMDEFRTNLIRALDDFVVRKERVVSNIGAKSTTHITFTKQSIFNHRE